MIGVVAEQSTDGFKALRRSVGQGARATLG